MNTKITDFDRTVAKLADWIESLKKAAEEDSNELIFWFKDTENEPFSIIGGWMEGFSASYSDILYVSRRNPKYAMCIKIAVNDGPYEFTDFELMTMPVNSKGEVEDTCIALELEDNSEALALFLLTEWERITKENLEDDLDDLED